MSALSDKVRSLPNYREPVVGEDIHVPSAAYLSHGRDDFHGGLCKIIEVGDRLGGLSVRVAERPSATYNWYVLIEGEEENRERYGDQRGYPDPDEDPEFNEW